MSKLWSKLVTSVAILLIVFGSIQLKWVFAYFLFPISAEHQLVKKEILTSSNKLLRSLKDGEVRIRSLGTNKKIILMEELQGVRDEVLKLRNKVLTDRSPAFAFWLMLISFLSSIFFYHAGRLVLNRHKNFRPALILSLIVGYLVLLSIFANVYFIILPFALLTNRIEILSAKIGNVAPPLLLSKLSILKAMYGNSTIFLALFIHFLIAVIIFLFFSASESKGTI